MAAGPQLLTVSGAPLHGLWLCLIEEQGYEGHHPSLEPGQVCEGQGTGRLAGHLGAEEGAAEESDLGEHPAWGSSRPGGKAGLDTLKDSGLLSWNKHILMSVTTNHRHRKNSGTRIWSPGYHSR